MRTPTKEAAHGRWPEILPALGFSAALLDGKHHACPCCGGTDRFRFDNGRQDGDFFCSQCGPGSGFTLIKRVLGWDFKEAAAQVDRIIGNLPDKPPAPAPKQIAGPDVLNRLWQAGEPVSGNTIVQRYFEARGLVLDLKGYRNTLRLVPALTHSPTKTKHPCLIAQFRDAEGNAKQIHRTYLSHVGSKANVTPNRMFMPGELPAGGAIRLGQEQETMGVAEGIETALSASALHSMPVWATTSEGLLQKWSPPSIARHITIFGDADENYVGQTAAYALAKRLVHEATKAGMARTVTVKIPTSMGTDWNDVLTAMAK
jgi:putative DNA primase/helicase